LRRKLPRALALLPGSRFRAVFSRRFRHARHATVPPMLSAKARAGRWQRRSPPFLNGLLALALPAVSPAQTPPPPIASYEISCRLDTDKKTIEGTELLTWTNGTTRPADTLRFHLYLNAFRNTRSTFWKESRGEAREGRLLESWGSVEIVRMTLQDNTDLLPMLSYISPDDGNPDDRTVGEIRLPRPVGPGRRIGGAVAFPPQPTR